MKTLFVPAKIKYEINEKKINSLKLPKNIAIAYSIQYKNLAEKIKEILSKNHKITSIIQVLGCSSPKFSKETEAILLLSSGRFHAFSLQFESGIPVYILEANKLKKISNEEVESFRKKKTASYMKFLNAEKVGVLISTKPGQENLKTALSLKLKNKKYYFFIGNNIDTREFENFGLNSWVNTACPRLDLDSSVINLSSLNSGKSKNGF
ncbi:2-(3-amino-3-carboxypropyl)histidine synthase [uncultured archaeon]|nr:2-(3-amino-3-carboxypropyl)histidine synthase [uncultured archaeon]